MTICEISIPMLFRQFDDQPQIAPILLP